MVKSGDALYVVFLNIYMCFFAFLMFYIILSFLIGYVNFWRDKQITGQRHIRIISYHNGFVRVGCGSV